MSVVIAIQSHLIWIDNRIIVLYGYLLHGASITVFLFLSMPLILNSPISFVIMLGYLPIIAKRIRNEEEVLKQELDGYTEYMNKVRWRLIPLIW